MKTCIGIVTVSLLLTASAWAGADFSFSVDSRHAGPSVSGKTAVWGDDPGERVDHRYRGRGAQRDQRIEILDQRLRWQRQRIREGQESGRLTPREARRLWSGFQQIEQYSQVAFADNWLSQREWRNLMTMLDRSDSEIERLRHNRRYADPPRWRF